MLRVDVSRRRCVKAEELSDSVEWSYDYGNLSGTAGDLHSSQSKFGTGVYFCIWLPKKPEALPSGTGSDRLNLKKS